MDFVYVFFPATSLFLSRTVVKKSCFETSLAVNYRLCLLFTTIAVAGLGFTGYDVYQLNAQKATTAFLSVCWLLGNGYILVNSFCDPYFNILYILLLLAAGIVLYNELHSTGKFLGRDMVLPFLILASFLLTMAIYKLPVFKRALKQ